MTTQTTTNLSTLAELESEINKGKIANAVGDKMGNISLRMTNPGKYAYEFEYLRLNIDWRSDETDNHTLQEFIDSVLNFSTDDDIETELQSYLTRPVWFLFDPTESGFFASDGEKLITTESGKTLLELAHEVDVLRKSLKTVFNSQACISWQTDGTLTYFSYEDGYPAAYYAEHTDFANNREDFTSLERLVDWMKRNVGHDAYTLHLLTEPVWCVIEDKPAAAMCHNCNKKPPVSLPSGNTVYCSEQCEDEEGKDLWLCTTGFKIVKSMHREDVEKLRSLIKSVLPSYSTPYPIWQVAESLAKSLAETDWQKELEGTKIETNLERMFPSAQEERAPTQPGLAYDAFDIDFDIEHPF